MTFPKSRARTRQAAKLMLILCVVVILASSYLWWQFYGTPPLNRYDSVLVAFKNHSIPTTEDGRVDLAKQFPGVTGHNDAYITYREDGTFIVMFPTYYGKGSEITGLLYTSRPLTDEDTHARISAIHFDQKLVAAGSYANLLLDKRINANWYQVSYRMH
jgi:hypothetical protein